MRAIIDSTSEAPATVIERLTISRPFRAERGPGNRVAIDPVLAQRA